MIRKGEEPKQICDNCHKTWGPFRNGSALCDVCAQDPAQAQNEFARWVRDQETRPRYPEPITVRTLRRELAC